MKSLYQWLSLSASVLLFGCSTISNMDGYIGEGGKKPLLNIDIIAIQDKREYIDIEQYADVPWDSPSGFRSENYPKLDESKLKEIITNNLTNRPESDGELKMVVIDARQGHRSYFFSDDEFAWVELEMILDDSGSKKIAKPICYSYNPEFSANDDDVRKAYDQAFECAIKKGLEQLVDQRNNETTVDPVTRFNYSTVRPDFKSPDYHVEVDEFSANEDFGVIYDTAGYLSSWKLRLYYLQGIDEVPVNKNSLTATRSASYMTGSYNNVVLHKYKVPVGQREFKVRSTSYASAPITMLFTVDGSSEKSLRLSVEKGREYYIKGYVDREVADVWIEDSEGNIVSQ